VTSARRFGCRPHSVPAARRFVRDVLSDHSRKAVEAVELMATELATNCVQHAQTAFELTIHDGQGQIRIEVRDTGPGRPVPQSPTPLERRGRGLRIVEAMSDGWGVDPSSQGKTVWFTVPQSGGAQDSGRDRRIPVSAQRAARRRS
jgi:anti-sigma regulatory factor (Ser/Thr protein kinase)